MTINQFQKLKGGDLIVWKGRYLRTVLTGPADGPFKNALVFSIRHRSWTNRATTTYGWNDIKHWIRFANKRARGVVLKSEVEVLKAARFQPRKELKRELKEAENMAIRMNRTLCKGFARLKKLAL